MKKCALFSILLIGIILTGCEGSSSANGEVLRIGLSLDESNPNAGLANDDFIDALEAYIEMPVEVIEDVTYLIGIEAMRAGNLDMMFASSFNYIQARAAVDVEILATLNPPTDTVTYFLTRADSDIYTLADFEGRTFAFVNESSTSGFLFPAYDLITEFNLDATQLTAPGHFFGTTIMSGGHDNSLIGLSHGDFDGAAVVDIMVERLHESGVINRDDFRIVGTTRPHPAPSYIVRSALDEALITQLRSFLLTYDNPSFFEVLWDDATVRFSEPDIEGYEYVESVARTLGIGQ